MQQCLQSRRDSPERGLELATLSLVGRDKTRPYLSDFIMLDRNPN